MPVYPSYDGISIAGMAGVAQAQYALLDSDGYPMGPTGSIAEGQSRGMGVPTMIKSAAGNYPAPRTVNVTGNNGRRRLKFVFTPAEIGEFDMQFGALDMNFMAASSGTLIETLGDWQGIGMQTDAPPAIAQLCLLFNIDLESADNTDFGKKGWFNLFIPICNVYPQGTNHAEAAEAAWNYRVSPVQSANHPWMNPFTQAINGFTKSAAYCLTSKQPLSMDTFVSDGSNAVVTLNYRPAEDETGNAAYVFRNGAASPITISSIAIASKRLTMASNGTAGDKNVIPYEVIDSDLLAA